MADGFCLAAAYANTSSSRLNVPNLTGPNALIEARAKFTHEVLSKLVIGAVALHVTGALKHHFIDHDGVLSRMLPFGAGIVWRRI
jgi:cytochrome b561